ncbi:MAG: AMP-binding protein [Pseudomonadota bacterium]
MSSPSFLQRFITVAGELPDHAAVVQEGRTTSYGELLDFAQRLAHPIAGHPGSEEGTRVLIHLPQSAEAYGAMFACAMAGAVYAPVNVAAPLERQRLTVDKFAPEVIVTNGRLQAEAESLAGDAKVVVIDALSDQRLSSPRPPARLVYVMFTSGSTGEAKGVMIPFDALSHYVSWAIEAMELTPRDRWSQHPNIAFDLSVLDIFGALCAGSTLYPLTDQIDLLLTAKAIQRHGLTIWNSVPSVMTSMVKTKSVTAKNFESLRLLTFCGEPLLKLHLDAIFAARPEVVVHNTYGPTEATVSCTLVRLTEDNYLPACGNSVAIGEAIPGMAIHLLDEDGVSGDEGEIVITGPQVADGYWRAPELSAGSFRDYVLDGQPVPAYYTGDWARREGAHTFFLGRRDNQVKIRGERIELDDIAAAVVRCGWGMATVAKVGEELHAFVEAEGTPPDQEAAREALKHYLLRHLIPDRFHFLKHLPRNVNDKIDRRKLIDWVRDGCPADLTKADAG